MRSLSSTRRRPRAEAHLMEPEPITTPSLGLRGAVVSRGPSLSTAIGSDARQQPSKVRDLALGGPLPLFDDVGDLVGVEEVNAVLELRNDRQDLGVVGEVVKREVGFQEIVRRDRGELEGEPDGRVDLRLQGTLEPHRDDDVGSLLDRNSDRHRVRHEAVHQHTAVDRPGPEDVRDGDGRPDRVHDGPAVKDDLIAGVKVRRRQVERDLRLLEGRLAERRPQALEDQSVVDHAEALVEAEDPREEDGEERAVALAARQLLRPEPAGHRLRGLDVVSQGDERRVEAPAAASNDHVDADPLALQDLQQSERGGALDAARAQDHRDPRTYPLPGLPGASAHAGKLATADSMSGKSFKMCVNPESSRTRRTSGCTPARRRSPPCWRVSLTVSSRARRPALEVYSTRAKSP